MDSAGDNLRRHRATTLHPQGDWYGAARLPEYRYVHKSANNHVWEIVGRHLTCKVCDHPSMKSLNLINSKSICQEASQAWGMAFAPGPPQRVYQSVWYHLWMNGNRSPLLGSRILRDALMEVSACIMVEAARQLKIETDQALDLMMMFPNLMAMSPQAWLNTTPDHLPLIARGWLQAYPDEELVGRLADPAGDLHWLSAVFRERDERIVRGDVLFPTLANLLHAVNLNGNGPRFLPARRQTLNDPFENVERVNGGISAAAILAHYKNNLRAVVAPVISWDINMKDPHLLYERNHVLSWNGRDAIHCVEHNDPESCPDGYTPTKEDMIQFAKLRTTIAYSYSKGTKEAVIDANIGEPAFAAGSFILALCENTIDVAANPYASSDFVKTWFEYPELWPRWRELSTFTGVNAQLIAEIPRAMLVNIGADEFKMWEEQGISKASVMSLARVLPADLLAIPERASIAVEWDNCGWAESLENEIRERPQIGRDVADCAQAGWRAIEIIAHILDRKQGYSAVASLRTRRPEVNTAAHLYSHAPLSQEIKARAEMAHNFSALTAAKPIVEMAGGLI